LCLVGQQFPVRLTVGGNFDFVTQLPFVGNVSFVLLTVAMRSKSTRSHAFVSPAAACQNVAGLPAFASRYWEQMKAEMEKLLKADRRKAGNDDSHAVGPRCRHRRKDGRCGWLRAWN